MVLTKFFTRGALWLLAYVTVVLSPLLLVQIGGAPPRRDFWTEFSVALGLVGLSMLMMQFIITARFRKVAVPYGLDILLQFHRLISIGALCLVLLHPISLFVTRPETLALLDPINAPARAKFAQLSLYCLLLLVATSIWRRAFRLSYEWWRIVHGLLAIGVVMFGLLHALLVGHYLDLFWKQFLWTVMGITVVTMLFYVRLIKPFRMWRRPYEVVEVEPLRGDSYAVRLRPKGHDGFAYKPGQFAWLTLGNSPFAIEEHPFSFSSSAERPGEVEFTIKELGDFTSQLKHVEPGTTAYLDGPRGIFTIDRVTAPEYVFIAGGIGISPIMGILRTMADRNDSRDCLLIYASKTWDGVTYREELEQLSDRLNLRVVHVLEEPPDDWEGESGFINEEILNRHLPKDREEAEVMMCGPGAMMDAVQVALEKAGVPMDNVHLEYFTLIE
jgi:predicted ferric reductase